MPSPTLRQPRGRAARRDEGELVPVDPASLSRLSMEQLDELFTTLEPAVLEQLQGHKRGRMLAMTGLDWVPAPLRHALLNRGPWRGEQIDGEFGANAWLSSRRSLEFARYIVREAPSIDGSGPVLRLDYDVAKNPRPLRGLFGELRQLGPGLFLARLYYRRGRGDGRVLPISYFTLES